MDNTLKQSNNDVRAAPRNFGTTFPKTAIILYVDWVISICCSKQGYKDNAKQVQADSCTFESISWTPSNAKFIKSICPPYFIAQELNLERA